MSHHIITKENSLQFWFIFQGQKLLLTEKMEIPNGNHAFIQNQQFIRKIALSHTAPSHFVAELGAEINIPLEFQLYDLRSLYYVLSPEIMALAAKARQLMEWDRSNQFCGECGSPTQIANHEYNRTCANESCKRIFYPRITPVVIVAVERGQEILLARSPHFPPEIYSALAGFVEPGESVEECAHREVFEETGIKIKNLRYFASQPWPFPSSLILGFQADYESGDIVCAPNEIEAADFFPVDSLPKTFPGKVSISQLLLQDFCKRHGSYP